MQKMSLSLASESCGGQSSLLDVCHFNAGRDFTSSNCQFIYATSGWSRKQRLDIAADDDVFYTSQAVIQESENSTDGPLQCSITG
jgi:hypothetical protein